MSQKSPRLPTSLGSESDATLGKGPGVPAAANASWRFFFVFGMTAAVLLASYYFPYRAGSAMRHLLDRYLRGYAAMAGGLLRLFEPSLVVSGQDIIGRYSIRIVKTCDGMDVNILLASAIMAWPCALRRRLIAVATGLALLVVTNTARICTLYYVGVFAPASFDFVHHELWPAAILVIAVAVFLVFIANTRAHATP